MPLRRIAARIVLVAACSSIALATRAEDCEGDLLSTAAGASSTEIVVVGSTAFVTTENAALRFGGGDDLWRPRRNFSGLLTIDVEEPENPKALGFAMTPGGALDLAVAGNIVYIADGDAGLTLVDVSDLARPTIVATIETRGEARGVATMAGIAYVADGDAGLTLVDVSDPLRPRILRSVDTPGAAWAIEVSDGWAYVSVLRRGSVQ